MLPTKSFRALSLEKDWWPQSWPTTNRAQNMVPCRERQGRGRWLGLPIAAIDPSACPSGWPLAKLACSAASPCPAQRHFPSTYLGKPVQGPDQGVVNVVGGDGQGRHNAHIQGQVGCTGRRGRGAGVGALPGVGWGGGGSSWVHAWRGRTPILGMRCFVLTHGAEGVLLEALVGDGVAQVLQGEGRGVGQLAAALQQTSRSERGRGSTEESAPG